MDFLPVYLNMTKNNIAVKAVATVTVFSVFTRGLAFIFKIYLAQALGAEAMGLYQICLSLFYLFASLSASGLPLVLSRKTAENAALGKKEDPSLFSSTLVMGVSVALATILVLFLAKPILPRLAGNPKTLPLLLVMLPAVFSTTIYSVIRGWFWGRKQFTYFSITETAEELLRILFSVLFVSGIIAGVSGAYGIALAFTVSDFSVAVILLIMFFVKGGRISKPAKIKEIFLPALPISAMRVFGSLIATLLAVMLPARLAAAGMSVSEATASFGRIAGMANPLILAPNAIISSLAIVLIPEMSASGAKKEYITLNRHINSGINFSLLISGVFIAAYLPLGKYITQFLFKDTISGEYLMYATFLMIPMCISQMTQSALNSIGMEFKAFKNYLIGTVFMLLAIYFLPKYIGIYASAVASFLSMTINSVVNIFSLRKRTGYTPAFWKILVMTLIFLFPSAFFAYSVYGLCKGIGVFGLAFAIIAGCLMYGVLCVVTDLVDIKGFLRMKFKKRAFMF